MNSTPASLSGRVKSTEFIRSSAFVRFQGLAVDLHLQVGRVAFAEIPGGGVELKLERIVLERPDREAFARGRDLRHATHRAVVPGDHLDQPLLVAGHDFGFVVLRHCGNRARQPYCARQRHRHRQSCKHRATPPANSAVCGPSLSGPDDSRNRFVRQAGPGQGQDFHSHGRVKPPSTSVTRASSTAPLRSSRATRPRFLSSCTSATRAGRPASARAAS